MESSHICSDRVHLHIKHPLLNTGAVIFCFFVQLWVPDPHPFDFFFIAFQTAQQQQLSKKEIEDLLKRGAYGAIMDEEDEGAKFCEEDIDQILQRRTKTITIESEGRGSTFAKVS